jgi:hypothetical protein
MAKPLPIACSLDPAAAAERLTSFSRLTAAALIRAERRTRGIELTFHGNEEIERDLLAFIEAERRCCPFLDFELARGEELRLRIGGPDEAGPILDAFLTAATPTPNL